jgi:hypothetical protein
MANPDDGGSRMDSLVSGFPAAIFLLLITMFVFQFKDSIYSFYILIWLTLPFLAIIIAAAVNFTSQYISCRKVNAGKALLGSLPAGLLSLIGLGISSISYCRIPVASVFTPIIIGKSVNVVKNNSNININSLKNSNSKECCVPRLTLENIEDKYPLIEGISYGFYLMFSMLFGMVIGNGIATIC